tara:strand:+ start:4615 stop:9087 length:4473 start_codon:yes stop_codon:yes gene_type:complete
MDPDGNANLDNLVHLLLIWHRNNLRSSHSPPSATLDKAEHDFLWYAITQERAAHNLPQVLNVIRLEDNPPSVQQRVMEALDIDEGISDTEANELHLASQQEVREHMEACENIGIKGVRKIRCNDPWQWAEPAAIIDAHLRDEGPREIAPPVPNWYDETTEDPYVDPAPQDGQLPAYRAGGYTFDFLNTAAPPQPDEPAWRTEWYNFVSEARSDQRASRYFFVTWSVERLERLRVETINEYYSPAAADARAGSTPPAPDLRAVAIDLVNRWRPVGSDSPWHQAYVAAVNDQLQTEATWRAAATGNLAMQKAREVKDRAGKANDLFVWRLLVVHMRALRAIWAQQPAALDRPPVLDCCDTASLAQTFAHLLKYCRCVRWAKSLYQSNGVGSLHDQYRAGLLNKKYAHAHQDQSDTEIGIARRMIRQAHVANFVHYQYPSRRKDAKRERADVQCIVKKASQENGGVEELGPIYRAEAYYTNPPMAPILCSAPPGMGEVAMPLLVASFVAKLDGNVKYGVWPHKNIAAQRVIKHLRGLGWVSHGLGGNTVHVYAHNETASVVEVAEDVHRLGSSMTKWVLHIRDDAHLMAREQSVAQLKERLEDTYPLFYGLNLCVSTTLLPTMGFEQLVGSDASICKLLEACHGRGAMKRHDRERCVLLQPWSFPIGPDCLVPPKTQFPVYGSLMEPWYRGYYGDPEARSSNRRHYGQWFHTKPDSLTLDAREGVLLDDALYEAVKDNQKWIDDSLRNFTRSDGAAPFKPTDAYAAYLKNFNKHSTKFWDEAMGTFQNGGPRRTVNAPIQCLTADAAKVAKQAEAWLKHKSLVRPATDQPTDELHPMLLLAATEREVHKNGDLDWAVLLCKLAWLRMHKDYVNGRIPENISPEILAERYGIVVLVHTFNRDEERYVDVIAQLDDIKAVRDAQVVAITFDPRLAHNRFKNHAFDELPEGRLLPSALIPTLDADDIRDYKRAWEAAGKDSKGLSAYNFLRDGYETVSRGIRARLYRFDMRQCYTRERCDQANTSNDAQDADTTAPDLEPMETAEGVNDNEDDSDHDYEISGASDLFSSESDSDDAMQVSGSTGMDVDGDDVVAAAAWPLATQQAASAQQEDTKDEVLVSDPSWAVKWYDEESAARDARVADAMVEDCSRPDQGTDGHGLTDLNGIALRLCVRGHASVQDAIKDAAKACRIRKVAVVGFRVLDHGQVQTTLPGDGDGAARHHYVPRYMSIAPNETNGRDLSKLYRLVGRGFVATGLDAPLPTDWRLNLLATKDTRKICRLYGNAELLLGRIRNESIEGRKLTLGTVLTSITRDNRQLEYEPILNEPLRGGKTNPRTGLSPLVLKTVLVADDEHYHTPFRVVRDCLSGVDAPKRQLAQRTGNQGTLKGVLLESEFKRTPDILDDELQIKINCADPRDRQSAVETLAENLNAAMDLNNYEDEVADGDGDGDGDGADNPDAQNRSDEPGPSSRGYVPPSEVQRMFQQAWGGESPGSSSS